MSWRRRRLHMRIADGDLFIQPQRIAVICNADVPVELTPEVPGDVFPLQPANIIISIARARMNVNCFFICLSSSFYCLLCFCGPREVFPVKNRFAFSVTRFRISCFVAPRFSSSGIIVSNKRTGSQCSKFRFPEVLLTKTPQSPCQ